MSNEETFVWTSITEASKALANKSISSIELTQTLLKRIEAQDDYYGAYVYVDREGALKAARQADDQIAAGEDKGPLHGIPVAIKDIFGVQGMPTRCGSVIEEQFVPDTDAVVVRNLRAAGAVILGKVATTEFALSGYHPTNTPPQNPWGHDRWAGVSSSGSGVATAAGLAFGALGTDTGGSVRYPAAANGVVGLKPTHGSLSVDGVFPLAPSLDHVGTFARCVADAALLYEAARGTVSPSFDAEASPAGSMRIGVNQEFVDAHADPEVAGAVRKAVEFLASQGHKLVDVDLSVFSEIAPLWGGTTAFEAAQAHKDLFPEHADSYGPVFRDLLEQGVQISEEDIGQLKAVRAISVAKIDALMSNVDVLAIPSAPLPAMALEEFPPQAVLPPETVAEFVTFTAPLNFSGHPTLSAPCGFSKEGLPLSLQLVGQRQAESTLLQLMASYERATDWHLRRPPAPPLAGQN